MKLNDPSSTHVFIVNANSGGTVWSLALTKIVRN